MDRKKAAALASTLALLGGGSAVAVDQQIDPYTERADKFEVQIEGETVEIAKDRPEVKLNRWGGEESLIVKKSGPYGEAKRGWFSRQQRWDNGAESVIVEPLKNEGEGIANADTGGEEGFEISLILEEIPNNNRFCWTIEGADDLSFHKQRPLWIEEGLEEPTDECTATDCNGAHRPENVINSFAIYHNTKRDHIVGYTNYETGKLLHRYRAQAVDSEGNTVWGDSEYTNGEICDIIPQEWLETAVYPVRL